MRLRSLNKSYAVRDKIEQRQSYTVFLKVLILPAMWCRLACEKAWKLLTSHPNVQTYILIRLQLRSSFASCILQSRLVMQGGCVQRSATPKLRV
mmetsp:Transcript_116118/g.224021  ORF Transcript_116118/g.224021 Transcript_116118/m.224021 type:complete len:94 (-) Transcript_116118:590-871(-)